MTATSTPPESPEARRDALVERLFMATVGTWEVLGVYVGDRLGLYRTLTDRGPCTSAELADVGRFNERYVREWLEQQAASGILELEDAGSDSGDRRFSLPAGHDEALIDDGIDLDAASIEAARRHLAGSGLEERVTFQLRDAADEELAGAYDLVYIHEALHDMS